MRTTINYPPLFDSDATFLALFHGVLRVKEKIAWWIRR
jgi:hypothetical protein